MTNVSVIQRIGSATFPRCTADEFERGVLTVTALDDGRVVRIFTGDTWREATIYDRRGYPEALFTAQKKGGR